jgi:DNA-binding CsgD family transcriptional regulator
MWLGPYEMSTPERERVLAVDRHTAPYLLLRDGASALVLHPLEAVKGTILGRAAECDVPLAWDQEVSRAHARLECHGGVWSLVDDGLSRNGTFLNEERLQGRATLRHGDVLRVGRTVLVFRQPVPADDGGATVTATDTRTIAALSAAELRVLRALCRPLLLPDGAGALPASNVQIAEELVLSIAGVKTQLRALFDKFGVPDLPQNHKRTELARRAIATGVIGTRDLAAG